MLIRRVFVDVGLIGVVPVTLAALAGCSTDTAASGSWVVEREERGDTLIVRTISGSVWARPMSLVEELRIGALDGPARPYSGRAAPPQRTKRK